MSPATSFASSKATSPQSFPAAFRFIPTSITTAPGLIQEPRIISARPTAATTTSPVRTTEGRSTVREWQIVTVAWRERSRIATGFPTMLLRPTTTACFPFSVHLLVVEHGEDAVRRAREERGPAREEAPGVHGMEAVDVLGRIDRLDHLRFVDLLRKGQLDEDPVDGIVGVEPRHEVEQLGLRRGRGKVDLAGEEPRLGGRLPLVADIHLGRGVFPHEDDGEAGTDARAGGELRHPLLDVRPGRTRRWPSRRSISRSCDTPRS